MTLQFTICLKQLVTTFMWLLDWLLSLMCLFRSTEFCSHNCLT